MTPAATSLRLTALLTLTLLFAHAALAQQSPQTRGRDLPDTASEKRSGSNFHFSFASAEFAFGGGVIVRGAPFSAVAVSETVQTLSDGSHVTRRRTARLYRDAEGRARIERGHDANRGQTFTLYEAVSGATYVVSARHRSVLELVPPAADASTRRAKVVTRESPPEDIRAIAGETIESLGTRVIEGVEAEGVRVTSQAPAKAGGQPGRVVYERWYSHELRRDVLIKCSDPRFGEAVFRLTGINRAEPSPDLFAIPAGYKVGTAFGRRAGATE